MIKVTVSITTYNHEEYIKQAVESALSQKTNFEYEILIGEDDSSDNTREIVKTLKNKYPNKIRLLLNDRKNVIYINGKPTGRWNFVNNLKNIKGKYIALLEGDDYWTDPLKLQKQVDCLENNPGCSISCSNVYNLDEVSNRIYPFYSSNPNRKLLQYLKPKTISTIYDLLKHNFIHTCSVMFRSGIQYKLPLWFNKSPLGDWPLHTLNSLNGDIYYIDEIMATYRMHDQSNWSNKSYDYRLRNTLKTAEFIKLTLDKKYQPYINQTISRLNKSISNQSKKELGSKRYNFSDIKNMLQRKKYLFYKWLGY